MQGISRCGPTPGQNANRDLDQVELIPNAVKIGNVTLKVQGTFSGNHMPTRPHDPVRGDEASLRLSGTSHDDRIGIKPKIVAVSVFEQGNCEAIATDLALGVGRSNRSGRGLDVMYGVDLVDSNDKPIRLDGNKRYGMVVVIKVGDKNKTHTLSTGYSAPRLTR